MKVVRWIGRMVMWMVVLFLGLTVGLTVLYRFVPVPISPLMVVRLVEQVENGEQLKLAHKWVDMDEISKSLAHAVWASEDENFFVHNGFDFEAIERALKENEKRGYNAFGASTISQQTAKNVFLWPSSTWTRKGFEVYFTVLIETFWSKQRIMEVYLNTIEMGDGIYGAEAVALEHFGCRAKDLNDNQAALIAASLPNPRVMNSGRPSSYMYKRQRFILRMMRNLGAYPVEVLEE